MRALMRAFMYICSAFGTWPLVLIHACSHVPGTYALLSCTQADCPSVAGPGHWRLGIRGRQGQPPEQESRLVPTLHNRLRPLFACTHTHASTSVSGLLVRARMYKCLLIYICRFIYLYIFMHTYLCIHTCIVHADRACRFSQQPAKKTTDSIYQEPHTKTVYVVYLHIYIYTNIHTY